MPEGEVMCWSNPPPQCYEMVPDGYGGYGSPLVTDGYGGYLDCETKASCHPEATGCPIDCFDGTECSWPPEPGCEQWGFCAPMKFCVGPGEHCPIPPPQCTAGEMMCWEDPPMACWTGGYDAYGGYDATFDQAMQCEPRPFCAPEPSGCPVTCYGTDVMCSSPPHPDCDPQMPGDCSAYNYCAPANPGCPPPPVYCSKEEVMCYNMEHHYEYCESKYMGCPVTCGAGDTVCFLSTDSGGFEQTCITSAEIAANNGDCPTRQQHNAYR
jgi:hypothetical protein